MTLSDSYGRQIQHWNGVDVMRVPGWAAAPIVQGGTEHGPHATDNCAIVAQAPELNPLGAPVCHQVTHWLTQVKLLATYRIPKVACTAR